ncbi:MAG TPA: T9SS type A sorting domain-containing protein [Caldithrix abyssi]|uniref:T9SS type A sorting domain-containing protein n=1 Tax=Caldithrix abyssi TaxID=187145 RepID=A0A7V4WV94_CALAY|nr:T9SS type A sorting domain-containing protein [Caldithrix abyssi]
MPVTISARLRAVIFILLLPFANGIDGSLFAQASYFVSPSGDDQNDGSFGAPFATIAHALGYISAGDTLYLLAGNFNEQIVLEDRPPFVLKGYEGYRTSVINAPAEGPAVSIRYINDRTMRLENLVITHNPANGTPGGPGLELLGSSATVYDCAITANALVDSSGGGVRIIDTGASVFPLLENCDITDNTAAGGAGLYARNARVELRNNRFRNNDAGQGDGGAVKLVSCYGLEIHRNQMINNKAGRGGGLFILNDQAQQAQSENFTENLLYANSAFTDGGAIYLEGNSVTTAFLNNTLAENIAQGDGAGLFARQTANIIIRDNIVVNNRAGGDGGGFHLQELGTASVDMHSNQVSANQADGDGGGVYFLNCDNVSIGGAENLQNNFFHNRANGALNAVYSASAIASLGLDYNYWGFKEENAVKLQIVVPGSNLSNLQYALRPFVVENVLLPERYLYWFGDGKLSFEDSRPVFDGSGRFSVALAMDTLYDSGSELSHLNKLYALDLPADLREQAFTLSLYYDTDELNDAGSPDPARLLLIYQDEQQGLWQSAPTTLADSIQMLNSTFETLPARQFGIGFQANPPDTAMQVWPIPNSAEMLPEALPHIRFNQPVNSAFLNDQFIRISGMQSAGHGFTPLYDAAGNTLYLQTERPFYAGEEVRITLSDTIFTQDGKYKENGYAWHFNVAAFYGSGTFQPTAKYNRAAGLDYATGDLDADGRPDLLELRQGRLIFLRNDGLLNFVPTDSITPERSFTKLLTGDLNGDDRLDVFLFNDSYMQVYHYNPSVGFSPIFAKSLPQDGQLKDALWGDWNNDGVTDLAVLKEMLYFNEILIYYGAFDGGYVSGDSLSLNLIGRAHRLLSMDIDGDGLMDLLTSNGSDNSNLALLENTRTGFTRTISSAAGFSNQNLLQSGNVWFDPQYPNRREVLLSGLDDGGTPVLRVFNAQLDGSLLRQIQWALSVPLTDMKAADYDSDGRMDILLLQEDGTLRLVQNGLSGLTMRSPFATETNGRRLLSADLDQDSDLDILVLSEDGWRVYENRARQARRWWVRAGSANGDGSASAPFARISDALNRSFNGDSIWIAGGEYRENLRMDYGVAMVGYQSEPPRLVFPDGGIPSALIEIATDRSVILNGLELANKTGMAGKAGIAADGGDSLHLDGLTISGFEYGIRLVNSAARVENSRLFGNSVAQIYADNAQLNLRYAALLGNGNPDGTVSASGVEAVNQSSITLGNVFVGGHSRYGLRFENSSFKIYSSILARNDSSGLQSGAALYAAQTSQGSVLNSIFLHNGVGIEAPASTVSFRYNDFYGNLENWTNALPGPGTRFENPLFVKDHYPFAAAFPPGDSLFDQQAWRLAPGSSLIDAGHPDSLSGDDSPADMGMFGNLSAPYVFSERPQAQADAQDSVLIIQWQTPAPENWNLWKATALFRSEQQGFVPDTANMLALLDKGQTAYNETGLAFGRDYFYRLAFVDSLGGVTGYSEELPGRLDKLIYELSYGRVDVQLGQGDTLIRPVLVHNGGTVDLHMLVDSDLPDWMNILPKQRQIAAGDSARFWLRFSAVGLEKDSLYQHDIRFFPQEDSARVRILPVTMWVSYRDLLAPVTELIGTYPDTVYEALLHYRFKGDDRRFSTIGTPPELLRYVWRLRRINGTDTTEALAGQSDSTATMVYPVRDGHYLFEVAARDTAGNGTPGDINAAAHEVWVEAGKPVLPRNRWLMIAPSRRRDQFAQIVTNPDILALKRWGPEEAYLDVSPDSLKLGESYWVISRNKMEVDLNQLDFVPADTTVRVAIRPGWNQVGNPWAWNVSWQNTRLIDSDNRTHTFMQAVEDSLLSPFIYHYEAYPLRHYERDVYYRLFPNRGFWLYSRAEGTLQLDASPVKFSVNEEETIPLPKSDGSADALVQLEAIGAEMSDPDNFFGVCSDLDDFPVYYHSAPEPPTIDDLLRLYTIVDGRKMSGNLVEFGNTFKEQVWDIYLESGSQNEPVRLRWSWITEPQETYLFLYHLESGQWFNLNDTPEYTLEKPRSVEHFKLYATDNADFEPKILPTEFNLSQNYPNPFNHRTRIRLAVPYFADGQQAELAIYNTLGQRVKTLLKRKLESGLYEFTWDARNDRGRVLSSGIYFIRFRGEEFHVTRKMIFIK